MPKLLLFVPCDRVSYDAATSAASLIGVFQGFTVAITKEPKHDGSTVSIQQIPPGEAIRGLPIKWAAFALWRRVSDDADKEFTQTCELVMPSGQKSVVMKPLDFRMTKGFQRNTMNVVNFPVHEAGEYNLRLFLKEKGASGDPVLVAEYPILVTHDIEDGLESHEGLA